MSNRRKGLLFLILFFSLLVVSGCLKKKVDMNALGENGKFNYNNKDLGFEIQLPEEFLYFQTQRKDGPDFDDLEFYVPTSDINYPQEVSGYAKPVVIRVYDKDYFDKNADPQYKKFGEKKDKVHTVKFWEKVPADWGLKWSETMKKEIVNSLKTY